MPKRPRNRVPSAPPDDATQPAERVAAVVLGFTVVAALLLIDTRADAAFDAPKRLALMIGAAIAAGAALFDARVSTRRGNAQRIALGCFALAGVGALAATLFSPRRPIAFDSLRAMTLMALIPFVAARFASVWRAVVRGYLAGSAVNAAITLMQIAGIFNPIRYRSLGGRVNASAMIGNDGLLSLILAFAIILAVDLLVRVDGRRRVGVAALIALSGAAMFVNRSLTAAVVLVCGVATVLFATAARRRWTLVVAMAAIVIAGLGAAFTPRGRELRASIAHTDWNAALSYRLAPWAAALEMIRERPLSGWGPGTFGAEYATHLIAAEDRYQARLANPFLAGSYVEAHSEFLEVAAECGAASLLLLAVGISMTLARLQRSAHAERMLLTAILVAGAVAALTWFPMQRPATALLLLAAFGRAWRLAEGE
jgi:O-antigen ligase